MMKVFAISSLAWLTSALSVDLSKRDSPLDVELKVVGNTAVKASITNTGSEPLKIFKTGTILDDAAIEKVKVYQGGSQVAFNGIRLYVSTNGLPQEAFRLIRPGETVEKEFDIAETHDLSTGGSIEVVADTAVSYAYSVDSTDIEGIVPINSNVVSTSVDGAKAAAAHKSYIAKRTIIQSDCSSTQKDALVKAIAVCQSRAVAAAAAAQTNSAKITEYYKNDTPTVRSTVSGVFNKIANECANSTSGVAKQYCTDRVNNCGGGVIAYTDPVASYVVNCPGYFSQMVERSTVCHHDDKPFVTIHELTHVSSIKGTDDYGVYGYAAVKKLTAAQNLNHADTYALFANAIDIGGTC